MKPRLSKKRNHALTLIEVNLAIVLLVVLAAIFLLPMLAAAKKKSSRISCVNNLKQIGLAYRIWEGDNGEIPNGNLCD